MQNGMINRTIHGMGKLHRNLNFFVLSIILVSTSTNANISSYNTKNGFLNDVLLIC